MNAFSFLLKRIVPAALALAVITAIVILSFSPKSEVVATERQPSAPPSTTDENTIYTISETLGTKQLTGLENIPFTFDENNEYLLFAKGWGNEIPNSESVGGAQLWVKIKHTNKEIQITKDYETREAVLAANGKIYYTDRDQNLYLTNTNGQKQLIQTKVLGLSINKNNRYLVYQKLNPTWELGDYYDKALGLTLLDLLTLKEKRLTDSADDWGAIFTPDSKKIIFAGGDGYMSMNIDGSNKAKFANVPPVSFPSERPIFAANGKFFIFEADREIWLFEFNESFNRLNKYTVIGKGVDPKLSDDGKSITVLPPPEENLPRVRTKIDLSKYLVN